MLEQNEGLCMTNELILCVCGLSNCEGNGRVMRCRMCFDRNLAVYRLQLPSSHTFSLPIGVIAL